LNRNPHDSPPIRRGASLRGRAALALCALWVAAGQSPLGAPPRAALADDPMPGAAPAPAAGEVALDVYFKGAVVALDGAKIKLRYDFGNAAQQNDWIQGVPWNIAKDKADGIGVADGRLAIRGNVGARHVAEWEGDVTITCKLVPDGVKDIGGYLSTPDSSSDYVSFTIGETYFHKWDNHAGGDTGMMKFGKQFSSGNGKGGYVGFRYLDFRKPSTEPVSGKASTFAFGRRLSNVLLTLDDMKLDSLEPGNKMRVVQAGFYSIQSSMSVDDVVIEGTLAARFVEANNLALKTAKPLVADAGVPPVAPGLDPAIVATLAAYRNGTITAPKVVQIVADPSRSDSDRDAAAEGLRIGPRKALPAVVDLLYSQDLKSRAHGIGIVRGITGKNYGYDPKGSEKARAAAVRRLNEDIAEHPELLIGGGGG